MIKVVTAVQVHVHQVNVLLSLRAMLDEVSTDDDGQTTD